MHIHILGICGTFMGGLAILARQLGHKVTGSDANVYPPMSTQLEQQGIVLTQGYDPAQLEPHPDMIVIGNAMSRGNPCIEAVLDQGLAYTSGPQWLCEHVLQGRWVLACAGTHGKTTTSSMLAWVLDYAGMEPGYLIGGVPGNFGVSARLGGSPFFVIEADEYDSAFFDKRSKFIHYRPRTVVLNNLEFDHADIFDDLAAIQRQFHHLVRTVPANGRLILPAADENLHAVLQQGCWSETETTAIAADANWRAELKTPDGSHFSVMFDGQPCGSLQWQLTGQHNVFNALSAIAAARHVGVRPETALEALSRFQGVKRRMELLDTVEGIAIYDDFAHHPTAIETTLQGLRASVGQQRIIAVIEPRSNTMKLGSHQARLAPATADADCVIWYQSPDLGWSLQPVVDGSSCEAEISTSVEGIVDQLKSSAKAGDHIVIMSNGGFGGIHQKLVTALEAAKQNN